MLPKATWFSRRVHQTMDPWHEGSVEKIGIKTCVNWSL